MRNLMKLALATKFKEEDVENILLICDKTENPQVAVEILLGLYIEPKFEKYAKDDSYYTNRQFLSYDPFSDKVTFTGNRVTSLYAWFKKDDEPIEENIASKQSYYGDAMEDVNLKNREDFDKLYQRKQWGRTVKDETEESSNPASKWKKDEESYALAE